MPDLLSQLFSLYRDSFPASERRPESDLRSALSTSAYQLITKVEGTRLLGFAILFAPQNQDFALLEYLAVHPDHRSAGIGQQLVLSAIVQSAGRQVLAEVESVPTDAAADRRQQFYSRCGFLPIAGLKYQLPLPGNPPPMELWVYRAAPSPIQRETLSQWVTTIYTDVYRCSATDPRIGQMLAFVPDAV